MSDRLSVLVADDEPYLRKLIGSFIQSLGHAVIEAGDGNEAVSRFRLARPDLVLIDRIMPGLDGIEATRAIRAICGERWVPIVMISADDDEQSLVHCLEQGCDDYLIKPINLRILAAKISAFQRVSALQAQMDRQRDELRLFRNYAEEELSLTEHLMERLVRRDVEDNPQLQVWSDAARGASGDIVLSMRAENGATYLMLADATGHGLAAAVTLIPVANVFYAMAAKGYNVSTMVEEINRQVRTYCPVERFVALTLIAVRPQADAIEVWNGGNPPVIALDSRGRVVRSFKSRHMPVGILGPGQFHDSTEFLHYDGDLQLALFSDGLIEAGDREQYGIQRLLDVLARTPPAARLASLQADFRRYLGKSSPHDDVTFTLLDCPREMAARHGGAVAARRTDNAVAHAWHLDALLSAAQLKEVDLVPMVAEWSHKMGLSRERGGNFFLVLTELFVNALDHGLLQLPSELKQAEDGFERYFLMRQERLDELSSGEIHIVVRQLQAEDAEIIAIRLRDSGAGFTFDALQEEALDENTRRSGRGIALVRELCRRVEYSERGNEVYVELAL